MSGQSDQHRDECDVCDQNGVLLCCDYCSLAYHLHCLTPPLKEAPRGFWRCPACVRAYPNENHKPQRRLMQRNGQQVTPSELSVILKERSLGVKPGKRKRENPPSQPEPGDEDPREARKRRRTRLQEQALAVDDVRRQDNATMSREVRNLRKALKREVVEQRQDRATASARLNHIEAQMKLILHYITRDMREDQLLKLDSGATCRRSPVAKATGEAPTETGKAPVELEGKAVDAPVTGDEPPLRGDDGVKEAEVVPAETENGTEDGGKVASSVEVCPTEAGG